MNLLFALGLVMAAVLLQTLRFEVLPLGAVRPDLVLLAVVYIGLWYERRAVMMLSWLAGLLQDVMSFGLLGVGAFTKMLAGLVSHRLGRSVVVDNPLSHFLVAFLAGVVDGGLYFLGLQLGDFGLKLDYALPGVLLPQVLYSAFAAVVVFPLLGRLHRQITAERRPLRARGRR